MSLHDWIRALIRRPAAASPSCCSSQTTVEKTQECCFDSVSWRRCSRCTLRFTSTLQALLNRAEAEAQGAERFLHLNQDLSEISVFGPAVTCHVLRPLGGKGGAPPASLDRRAHAAVVGEEREGLKGRRRWGGVGERRRQKKWLRFRAQLLGDAEARRHLPKRSAGKSPSKVKPCRHSFSFLWVF